MPRYKLTLEYDGTDLVGWQRQDSGPSVQQHLEEAVFRFCGEEVRAHAAGRTDAGVHALGQVAHVELSRDYPTDRIRDAINFYLKPAPVAVLEAERVPDDFHARFSAVGRSYLYRIVNRRARLVIGAGYAWWIPKPLNAEAMHEAAQHLVGHYDFSTFRAAECQGNTPFKTLDRLDVERQGDEILIRAAARSFLHHQVRNMVGTLKLVGEGKWTVADFIKARDACDRRAGGQTAPACGLYFTGVVYPPFLEDA
ncbi:tRNA pseudouridine(38-40) synthase TruA [Telmatospirillum sp. J64-1]|uniref:tRNA pseudouridine(38-40) synthase TruA n=1 Tax=Telmatospirillum sp. J64-1 TaxID=2502183 RepID=UPI00115D60F2|nr:tRNA pseudouridine(38-40) synthase TruA [Telmatospirillum sp. J64-1]